MQDQYFNVEGIIYYLLTYSTPFSYRGSVASLGFGLGSIIKNIIIFFNVGVRAAYTHLN
jgi:hypothetical protein